MRSGVILGAVVMMALAACETKSAFSDEDSGAQAADDGAADAGAKDAGRSDAGTAMDGGSVMDAGADAGAATDRGATDAGTTGTDAGAATDRGTTVTPDAGAGVCMARDLGSMVGVAVATGNSAGGSMEYFGSCGGEEAPESAVTWTAPADGAYTFSTEGTDFDTVLYVNDATCNGLEIDCNDDTFDESGGLWSSVTTTLRRGQRVVIFVDGYADNSGDWTLNITRDTTDAGASVDSGTAADGGAIVDAVTAADDVPPG